MGSLMKMPNGVDRNWMFPQLPSLFDDFFTRDFTRDLTRDFFEDFPLVRSNVNRRQGLPAVNVYETPKTYEFEVAAPGMDKKDFKVELVDDTLVISSKREHNNEEKGRDGQYARREFSYQAFSRSFTLPAGQVDSQHVTARYKDGMLYVTVPKNPQALPKVKEIEIS